MKADVKCSSDTFFENCMNDKKGWFRYYGIYKPNRCKTTHDVVKDHLALHRSIQAWGQEYLVNNVLVVCLQTASGPMVCANCGKISHRVFIIQRIAARYKRKGYGTLFIEDLVKYGFCVLFQSPLAEGKQFAQALQMKPDSSGNFWTCSLNQKEAAPERPVQPFDARGGSRKRKRGEQPSEPEFVGVRTRSQTASGSRAGGRTPLHSKKKPETCK